MIARVWVQNWGFCSSESERYERERKLGGGKSVPEETTRLRWFLEEAGSMEGEDLREIGGFCEIGEF